LETVTNQKGLPWRDKHQTTMPAVLKEVRKSGAQQRSTIGVAAVKELAKQPWATVAIVGIIAIALLCIALTLILTGKEQTLVQLADLGVKAFIAWITRKLD
jgi:hypothetical protein